MTEKQTDQSPQPVDAGNTKGDNRPCTPCKCRPRWKCYLLKWFILGLLIAGILYMVLPFEYEAKALLRVQATKQSMLSEEQRITEADYAQFVNSQMSLIRSPAVIERVLEERAVAQLPVVRKQRDRMAWLQRKLQVKRDGNSEIVVVSIKAGDRDTSVIIVNAVVDVYLNFILEISRIDDSRMIAGLMDERRRHGQMAGQLQENIRAATRAAAHQGAANDDVAIIALMVESLQQKIAATEINLVAMRAKRKVVAEMQDEIDLSQLDLEIRIQGILLADLSKKYSEQLAEKAERAGDELEIAFTQTQLDRANRILRQIDDRILAVQAEGRSPGQVMPLTRAVSSVPCPVEHAIAAGLCAVILVFFLMLLCVFVRWTRS